MPRTRASAASTRKPEPEKPTEPENPVEPEEQVDLDGDNDAEETMEEEVEYEEVEEEEEEEEEEEDVEEEEEEEEETADAAETQSSPRGDVEMKASKEEDEDESKEHAELLALPPHGSEVYVGGIPHDASEEDLRGFCESIGEVTEVRIMKGKDSGENKGYAFVTFRTKELAAKAIEDLNNTESKVKAVYLKNLPEKITQDKLRELFEHHGEITKVVLPQAKSGHEKSRFGFVHFAERSSAMKALKNTEKYEVDGQLLKCSLAKPQADWKSDGGLNSHKSSLLPSYPPRMGYGLAGGAYGGMGAGYGGASFAQPLIYGIGPTPAGMAMMPMLLPDGRIGYVFLM